MTNGRDTRAKMDQEGVRGLLLINGGGAVALLAFFQALLDVGGFAVLIGGLRTF